MDQSKPLNHSSTWHVDLNDRTALVRELLLKPLLQRRRVLVEIAGASFVLALSQGLMVFLAGPAAALLFRAKERGTISLEEVFPSAVSLFPNYHAVVFSVAQLLTLMPLALVATALLKGVGFYLFQSRQELIAIHVATEYRKRLFRAVLGRPFLEVTERSPAEWMSIIINDVQYLQDRLAELLKILAGDLILVISGLIALLLVDFRSTLFILGVLLPLAWIMSLAGRRIAKYSETWQVRVGAMADSALDLRRRFEYIRAHGAGGIEGARFAERAELYRAEVAKSVPLRAVFAPALEFVGFAAVALFLWVFIHNTDGTSEFPLQFFVALALMLKPLRSVGEQFSRQSEVLGALRHSLRVLAHHDFASYHAESSQEMEPASNRSICLAIDSVTVQKGESIVFSAEGVRFDSGRCYAIVGASGAGKSSLAQVLVGLVRPERWEANVPFEQLADLTGFVSQKPFLFEGTLRENLLYGNPVLAAHPMQDELIWEQLDAVDLGAWLRAQGQDLEFPLSALRSNVSGGQIQRLAIARAILLGRPVLVLDEATSALDLACENSILTALIKLAKSRDLILILITHRVYHLHLFDQVIWIDKARVAGVGRHEELAGNPNYVFACS